ncbi:MAG: nucleoside kinase [Candidatus Marinimicrobia bacterium]|nr:nucleoside kinase [Candidatus Neomarinimicrobiota bacterium]
MKLSENQATLAFLLPSAFKELFAPRMLVIEHSFVDGYFCHEANWEKISRTEIKQLEKYMREWLWDQEQITFETWSRDRMIEELYRINSVSKLSNVQHWQTDQIPVIRFRDHFDYVIEPMSIDKTALQKFRLKQYNDGFIMRFPTITQPQRLEPFIDRPKLFSIVEEQEQWGSILGVATVWELNELIVTNKINEMLWVAEGLHEKKIGQIADALSEQFPWKRIITIAGPSSSGKTTFAKRLGIHLKVNGFTTKQISMDDYFLDRSQIPVDENGDQDFESISVMNVDLLAERLDRLVSGQAIPKREYDFNTGMGSDSTDTIQLDDRDFIIVEGIHGLNPRFADKLGNDRIQEIYISALTQLNIDATHRVSTSDNRLLRRIMRDHKFRGYLPEQTLERWPSVRLGEERNIFPYQEQADYIFNTALVYEFPVLAKYVCPLLKEIKNGTEYASEAHRLDILLSFFEPLDEDLVPGISILREFIGGSDLHY